MRLRDTLLRWVLLPTAALLCGVFALGQWRSLQQAHEAFDRTLSGAALVVAESLRSHEGQVLVELPAAALEMLRTDAQDRVFYRVLALDTRSTISGYDDLPLPAHVSTQVLAPLPAPAPAPAASPDDDQVQLYDADYRGEAVRVAALRHLVLVGQQRQPMLVLVAETIDARRSLSRRITNDALLVDLLLLVAAGGLITYGVQRGLRPLKALRDAVRGRASDDLTPVNAQGVPREVVPLIEAINLHTDRQRKLAGVQRRFIASASHQLKTPLTVLRAQAELALRQTRIDDMRSLVLQIHEATVATTRLAQQLLTLARSEPGHTLDIVDFDLAEAAREVTLGLVDMARGKQIDLGFEGQGPCPVRGEMVLLRELVANLVHNAITYTPPGGVVTVRLASAGRDGPHIELTVEDSGPGVPPELVQRVFEPFYRASPAGAEGSGLGLPIVKEICDRHRLEITLEPAQRDAHSSGLRVRVRWP